MKILRIEENDLKAIEGNRKRLFRAVSEPLKAQTIWDDIHKQQRQRVIIICNTVSQAQGIYRDLQNLQQILDSDSQINITLLHSRFLPEHRAQKETYLREKFARNWYEQDDSTCEILISTQVIEAGINITCQVLHTQLAPMNSLLQRAGRCARFTGEVGEVLIYRKVEVNQDNHELAGTDLYEWKYSSLDASIEKETEKENENPENIEKPKEKFLPYKKEICELTWEVLEAHTDLQAHTNLQANNTSENFNHHVGFRTEEEWINQVHSQEDLLNLERIDNNRVEFESKYEAAVFRGDESSARDLIRHVDNRNVFTWEESALIDFDDDSEIDIQKLIPFSVPISTLCKALRDFKESLGFGDDWIFKRIETPKDKSQTYAQPVLSKIANRNFLLGCYRILVNPRYISYDEEIGLQIGVNIIGNGFKSPPKQDKLILNEYRYRMDTYIAHLGCMWKCWRKVFTTKILQNGDSVEVTYNSVRDELLVAGGNFIKTKILP